jgi:hypothetical protein
MCELRHTRAKLKDTCAKLKACIFWITMPRAPCLLRGRVGFLRGRAGVALSHFSGSLPLAVISTSAGCRFSAASMLTR